MESAQQAAAHDLVELSRKTRIVFRSTVDDLFTQLEKYDSQERAETFHYLKRALNETRSTLGAEPYAATLNQTPGLTTLRGSNA